MVSFAMHRSEDIHIQVKGLISRGFVLEAREILL